MDGKSTYGAGTTLPEQRSYIDGAYASNQELAELETLDTGKPISETSVVDIATGADVIEVDHKVDLAFARRVIGDRSCVIGNIDPVTVLLQGTPEQVRTVADGCLETGAGGGYILGSGCVVPRSAKKEKPFFFR